MTRSQAEDVGRAQARPTSDAPDVVSVRGVSKRFPGVQALTDVDFDLRAGEVHGLVGQNGAGKSTLMKIVSGVHSPDAGTVLVDGESFGGGSPRATRAAGISVIYQELTIVPEMRAIDNVFLDGADFPAGLRSRKRLRRRFDELGASIGIDIDPSVPAGTLSVAHQQQLEIMRALDGRRRAIVMDEPTASLGHHEREALYRIVAALRERGVGVVYISHDLDEVVRLCDRISVMRDGRMIDTFARGEIDRDGLVRHMVGTSVARVSKAEPELGEELLGIDGLTVAGSVEDVALSLRRGEVLGLAGLVGSGRTEILRALAGADRPTAGDLRVDGRAVAWPHSVRAALRLGIALVPEDRKGQGLILTRTAAENVVMSDSRPVSRLGFVSRRRRRELATAACGPFGFDTDRLGHETVTFSGGNQQKLALAKWLHRGPRVLLVDEPTRGIDIGAKAEVLGVLRRLASEGLGVILVSSELDELVEAADRVVVIAGGGVAGELAGDEFTEDRILELAFGAEARA